MDKRSSVAFLASRVSAISLAERAGRRHTPPRRERLEMKRAFERFMGRLLAGRHAGDENLLARVSSRAPYERG